MKQDYKFKEPLSSRDIQAVNEWHWPLSDNGTVDCYADIEIKDDLMKKYQSYILKRRLKHSICSYRGGWTRPMYTIFTIVEIGKKRMDILPEIFVENYEKFAKTANMFSYNLHDEEKEEFDKNEKMCVKIIDIYISSIKPGRQKNSK